MRGSSSCSCRPSTPRVLLHRTEGRTRWSHAAARRLWWRGLWSSLRSFLKTLHPAPSLASSLIAVGNRSTMKSALEPDLETHLLRAALCSVFTLGTEKDTINTQALYKVMPELLDAMLGNLLAESPDAGRLHSILEISAEFLRMGHHVAQLALFVSDPDKDISQQAREGTYRLYQLLLQQRGLTIHEAEDLWCHDWQQDSRLLGYKNTASVGEVFRKFFSEEQRKYFLQTAMLVLHDPLRVSARLGCSSHTPSWGKPSS
ncbi:uncharacterized protein LOC115640831 isoform X2 [Gopherus evgoodei]|uniref:uncharacterized protein LOC115640831 isoform X2 n=1 Tax=Gopherus evgoodei TaxID=1825980 RepID=UPI0011CED872|nr:uncharacterized protein LOC115640831 isoform X2 [Gopherus evgoodei]XP_030399719.1 uncharacterized protein LOC115640831 isoform X2 [Gopherus evgoodei]XP_030399720.1 uncharacterized protein LOC115640831 isoform X2 [Gopherus evgoodei]